jgi:hypothetical protein
MADEQQPKLTLHAPKVSPDGRTILFAFRYAGLNDKLAMMSSDPAPPWLRILELPPTMMWAQPAWAPDMGSFAAVSYCEHDRCHEGARGIHVWRFGPPRDGGGVGSLDRVSPPGTDVWRIRPFFGPTPRALCWVMRSTYSVPGIPLSGELSSHFLASSDGGQEVVFFPDDGQMLRDGPFVSEKFRMRAVQPSK